MTELEEVKFAIEEPMLALGRLVVVKWRDVTGIVAIYRRELAWEPSEGVSAEDLERAISIADRQLLLSKCETGAKGDQFAMPSVSPVFIEKLKAKHNPENWKSLQGQNANGD